MQKRRLIPLLLPDRGKIASVCLVALFSVIFSVTASAQTDGNGLPDKREYNKDVRTGTWSIYAQGGLSWATGVWYENVNAKKSYGMAPAVGGGGLERVAKALQEVGFAEEDLKPSIAIGSQRGIDAAEARRVTITVE